MHIEPVLSQVRRAAMIRDQYMADANQWRGAAEYTIRVDNFAWLAFNLSVQAALSAVGIGVGRLIAARLETYAFYKFVLTPTAGGGGVAAGETARRCASMCEFLGKLVANQVLGVVGFVALEQDKNFENAVYSFLTAGISASARWAKLVLPTNVVCRGYPALVALEAINSLPQIANANANLESLQIRQAIERGRRNLEEAIIQLFAAKAQAINDYMARETPKVMRTAKANAEQAPKYKLSFFSSFFHGRQEDLDMFLRFHAQTWAAFHLWQRTHTFLVHLYNYCGHAVEQVRSGAVDEEEVRTAYKIANGSFSLSRSH